MTPITLEAEPACPALVEYYPAPNRAVANPLRAERRNVGDIPRETWEPLAHLTPWATPFSGWAFQRAWWDAYHDNAHDETLIVCPAVPGSSAPGDAPVAIVPLMHRHEVEPGDALTRTTIRHGDGAQLTPVEPTATAVFFGASYHADYATILGAPGDLPAIAAAVADHLADTGGRRRWDVVDLRRLRCGDPAADALAGAFGAREIAEGWTLNVEREDVCPVVHLPAATTMDGYLATLGKKERHEIRRKVRRAHAAGEVRLETSPEPLADLEAFIDLHQKRWGVDGLFPDTPGGAQSRVFIRRLFELAGPEGPFLTFLTVGGRRIAAGVHFETPEGDLYYNAGVDPAAKDLSPGVVMVYAFIERALAAGKRRVDFMRGNEPYKYVWGAEDEPIQRILVRRRNG